MIKFLSLRADVRSGSWKLCDCIDEDTECTGARVQGEEQIQLLSVASNASEQFAISINTDTDESFECLAR